MVQELQDLKVRMEHLQAENDRLRRERDSAQTGPKGLFLKSAAPEWIGYLLRKRRCPIFKGHHGINIDEWIEEV